MIPQVVSLFTKAFNFHPQIIAKAPGRLEILGNHTDYNEGFVLSAALDAYTSIAMGKSRNSKCAIYSPAIEDEVRLFDLSDIEKPLANKDWTNYIRGVILELQKKGHQVQPFNALITSSIPLSAGMSSSAALEMALLSGLCELLKIDLTLEEKARIGQACENNYIGANTGLMDQFTSLAGKKGKLVLSEYRNLSLKTIPFPDALSIMVFNSGVKHDLSNEYNERRDQCEKAVESLRQFYPEVKALRDVSMETLIQHKSDLAENAFKRAQHVVGENERVHKALQFLENKETEKFGQLLFDSHKSSVNNFENSCEELDFLVELAIQSPLCLGARLSGGGFGGISIHLVRNENVDEYREFISSSFKSKYKFQPESFLCKCSDGASIKKA